MYLDSNQLTPNSGKWLLRVNRGSEEPFAESPLHPR
jgi:hypothetical protein